MSRLAYSYIRFSSEIQAQGDSLRRQTELTAKWCEKEGYKLSDTKFEDLGVSGWSGANAQEDAGLGKFIKACEQGKIRKGSVLLVESLDRLSRADIKTAMQQLWAITKYVDVVTLQDNKRYSSGVDIGDFVMAGAIMFRAHEESETKSKRLKATLENKRNNPSTSVKSNSCPFWLTVSENKTTFDVIPEKASTVKKIFDLRESGLGNVQITKRLNSEGIPSPKGKQWSYVTVSKLLRSRSVLGEYRPNTVVKKKHTPTGQVFRDYYPAIISESQFNKVQLLINKNAKKVKTNAGGSTSTHRNILRDAGKCAKCGGSLISEIKRGCVYVRCKNSKVSDKCDSGSLRLDLFYDLLNRYFSNHMELNSWVSTVDTSDLDKQRVENDLAIKEREDELKQVAKMANLNESVLKAMIEQDDTMNDLLNERVKLDEIVLASDNSLSRVESIEVLQNLLGLAVNDTHEPENIQARLRIKSILDTFHSIRIYYSNYVAHVEFSDLEWSKVYFKSVRGASSVKADIPLWNFQEYKTLDFN
ncbi:recombinase family protein [Vibrio alginolyticus]